jgi:glyoxylase-like metal-dependent hydrolase (beta-lactamase superfamily II)/rhodanese-related sulfurtransferase
MYFKQFYLGCLAHASYLIGADGEAVVVDPQRDVEQYLAEAQRQGLRIRHVIETHLHADFVSGHRELAERAGARIYLGHRAGATFEYVAVHEGDEIRLGQDVVLRFLETPGHTPESISVLVFDHGVSTEPLKVLTGDTLFIGDVGRPDLVGSKGYSAAAMAGMLYDSLRQKLLSLPPTVEVYPAHGAGSACGRNISKETSSTIGREAATNYALQPMTREDFVRLMTTDLPPAPPYFSHDAEQNRQGAVPLDSLPPPPRLAPTEFARLTEEGAVVLDVRDGAAFGRGHVPGAINVGLGGQFASWAGTLLSPGQRLLIVGENDEMVQEARVRLARVGFENVAGSLAGGVAAWEDAGYSLARVPQVTVDELRREENYGLLYRILDVRRPAEYAGGHIPGAINLPLDRLEKELAELDPTRPWAVACASGYRSSAACSLLKRYGYHRIANVVGGTTAWTQAGHTVESTPPSA